MTVTETFHAYAEAKKAVATGRETQKQYEAALSLPQAAERAEAVSQADGIVRGNYAVKSWEASVADAAWELDYRLWASDNGGTAGSPREIRKAARDLLHLLGVSE